MKKQTKHMKKKDKKKNIGLKVFIVILVILAIAGGIFAKRVYDLNGNWLAALFGHDKHTLENLDKLYVLAMGESQGMSDTIIVCSYDPKTQEASMLSIPRDTYVGDDEYNVSTYDKINSLYNGGENPERTIEAVNKITGLNIENYVLIDTKALVELVDAIGGVDFYVPIDMKYNDNKQDLHIDLEEGWQKLSGSQVEQVVRFRHNADGSTYSYEYGMEDLGRMKTQREIIKEVVKQTVQFKNIKEVGTILDIAEKYVKTNMDFQKLRDYIPYAVNMNADEIKTEQLPGVPEYIGGISFFVYDEEETNKMVDQLFRGITAEQNESIDESNNTIQE